MVHKSKEHYKKLAEAAREKLKTPDGDEKKSEMNKKARLRMLRSKKY